MPLYSVTYIACSTLVCRLVADEAVPAGVTLGAEQPAKTKTKTEAAKRRVNREFTRVHSRDVPKRPRILPEKGTVQRKILLRRLRENVVALDAGRRTRALH